MGYEEGYTDDTISEIPQTDELVLPVFSVWTISFGEFATEGAVLVIDGISYTYVASPSEAYEVAAGDPYESLVDEVNGDGNADAHPNCTAVLTDSDEVTITATVARPFVITSEDENISDGLEETVEGSAGTPGQVGDMLLVDEDLYVKTESGWNPVGGGGGGLTNGEPINYSTDADLESPQVHISAELDGSDPTFLVETINDNRESHIELVSDAGEATAEMQSTDGEQSGIVLTEQDRARIGWGTAGAASSVEANNGGVDLSAAEVNFAALLDLGYKAINLETHSQLIPTGRFAKADLEIDDFNNVTAEFEAYNTSANAQAKVEAYTVDGGGATASTEAYAENGGTASASLSASTGVVTERTAVVSVQAVPGGEATVSFQALKGADAALASMTSRGIRLAEVAGGIASATTIAPNGNVTHVSGTNNIETVTTPTGPNPSGFILILIFDDVLTVLDGIGNLRLAGDFTTAADSTLVLVSDGLNWYEISRSTN